MQLHFLWMSIFVTHSSRGARKIKFNLSTASYVYYNKNIELQMQRYYDKNKINDKEMSFSPTDRRRTD